MTTRQAFNFQVQFAQDLKDQGFEVTLEAPCRYLHTPRKGKPYWRKGRIDILATKNGYRIAFELDNVDPRRGSIEKLKTIDANEAWVICRAQGHRYQIKQDKT